MRHNNRTTLSDVARRAGVSTATASLVLGGKAAKLRISEETLQRVQRAADELDYTPNLLVRSLQRGRTHILAFLNGFRNTRQLDDLYQSQLLVAIEAAAGRVGCNLLTYCHFKENSEEMYQDLNGGHADGAIVFAPVYEDPLLPLLRTSRLPSVLINTHDEEGKLASVEDDVVSGMRMVADALLNMGHRKIAVFAEPTTGHRDMHARLDLLQKYLTEAGVPIPDRWIVPYTRDNASELLRSADRPTAIFCWRDRLAYYLLELCEDMGVSVPDELSVIGYDGLPWPAQTRHTAISVKVDVEALGERAVQLLNERIEGNLNERIEGKTSPTPREILPVTLSEGTTLGPPPAN